MHFIRRAALRAASSSIPSASPSSAIIRSRNLTTASSPYLARSKAPKSTISPLAFRRFFNDEATDAPGAAVNVTDEKASVTAAFESAQNSSTLSQDSFANEVSAPRRSSRYPDNDRYQRPITDRPDPVPNQNIYVGNLTFDMEELDLKAAFSSYGPIKSLMIAKDSRGFSKGFGYVEYETVEAASAAIAARNRTELDGRLVMVNYQRKSPRKSSLNSPSKTVFIGNLAFEMTDIELNRLFKEIHNVIDVRVAIDRRTGQARGFAHADFVDVDSAVKGLQALQGREFYGRQLRCDFSTDSRISRPRDARSRTSSESSF